MLKYVLIVVAFVFITHTPIASAQSSYDVVLLRIDALILEMQKLKLEVEDIKSGGTAPASSVLGANASKILTLSLSYGETNSDIAKIQKLLSTNPEIYPYGVSSGFFGPKTREAIRNFQTHFHLDPVGVIGPATTALLEGYLRMYPEGDYPADIFEARPKVLGASTSVTPTTVVQPAPISSGVNPAKSIEAVFDDGEALITINYRNGTRKGLIADTDEEDEVVDYIASKTSLTVAQVEDVIEFEEESRSRRSSDDADENDADDALDDADDAIDSARGEINDADDDGDDVDWADETLDEAKDLYDDAEEAFEDEEWDDVVDLADEIEELAEKAEDRIDEEKDDDDDDKGDSDEIDSIEVDVSEDESDVTVEYEDGDEYDFTVDEDKEDNIIEEIADELDIDEDDAEDLISFDYGRLDTIYVRIDEDSSIAFVTYNRGVERRVRMNETDEDKIIEEIADAIDEDEEDVEDIVEFD